MHCLKISFVTGVFLVYLTGTEAVKSLSVGKTELSSQYESCKYILTKNPNLKGKDGVYEIYVGNEKREVFCDMTTEGGGWTVIQKRIDGSTDFYKNWDEYKNGFGDPCKNYWIGNDAIHILTEKKKQVLRVELLSFDFEEAHAVYSKFHVGNEASSYKLTVSGYGGTAGDSLHYHNGMMFSTWDRYHDESNHNCAKEYHGAWWYKQCFSSNLNAGSAGSGLTKMVWFHWKFKFVSLKGTLMMVRSDN
ncbi:ficolin-2-like [Ostrea edulis]|uniref:ficolin-2-like n=1 Tax=Ostrea edulis TaxID=37623 RepID=UPI0024AF1DE1|nr:ficolin-2-like [Ostrea edulis]